ncbi:MAG TPA: hypothetical protein DGK91_05605 [Clostridium sp.]|nr:hypothetical protein [Clostridium sp.]
MNRKGLRRVEVREEHKVMSLPGPFQFELGSDTFYDTGWFHGWEHNGDLKGIIEFEDGSIKLIPYSWIKFLDN